MGNCCITNQQPSNDPNQQEPNDKSINTIDKETMKQDLSKLSGGQYYQTYCAGSRVEPEEMPTLDDKPRNSKILVY